MAPGLIGDVEDRGDRPESDRPLGGSFTGFIEGGKPQETMRFPIKS